MCLTFFGYNYFVQKEKTINNFFIQIQNFRNENFVYFMKMKKF